MNDKLNNDILAQHIAIVGKIGSGKTYTGKGMVEYLLLGQRRVCIVDPTGVWWGLRSTASGKGAGFSVVVFGGAHADVEIAATSGAAVAGAIAGRNLPCIIDLSEMLIGDRHRFMTDFAEALYRANRQPLHLVLDEADEFCPQNPLPETKRMLHHVDRIVRRGRVRGFRVMLITQRPAVLHKNVLTQANTLIAMRLTSPQDRTAIRAWIDGQGDAVKGKAVLDSLASLPRGEGWVWSPEFSVLEREQFPKISTFDSSRTPDDDDTISEPTKLAAVDLTEIKNSFRAIEKEATTAAELRKENADLRNQLARAVACAPSPEVVFSGITEADVQERIREAMKTSWPVIFGPTRSTLSALIEKLQQVLDATAVPPPELAPPRSSVTLDRRPPARIDVKPRPSMAHAGGAVASGITRPQQNLLDSLARLSAFGIDRPEKTVVAALTGVSSKSSAYANNLGALRTRGLISYPAGGQLALTAEGARLAVAPDRAMTLDDLHDGFYGMVTRPQAAILRALIENHPVPYPKNILAAEVQASASSSAFANNLGALRTLGALDYPQPGMVAATSLLFPKGLK